MITASHAQLVEKWIDSPKANENKLNVETLRAIRENQTATFEELTGIQDNKVLVHYSDNCADTAVDCGSCDFPDLGLTTKSKEFSINDCSAASVVMSSELISKTVYDGRLMLTEQIEAANLKIFKDVQVKNLKKVDNAILAASPATAAPFTLDISSAPETSFKPQGSILKVGANAWNPELFVYLAEIAQVNNMVDPYIIGNGSIYHMNTMAGLTSGTLNSVLANEASVFSRKYFDLFNYKAAIPNQKSFFVIDRGTLAFETRNKLLGYTEANKNVIMNPTFKYQYTMPAIYGGYTLDVEYANKQIQNTSPKKECVSSEQWVLKLYHDLFIAPADCQNRLGMFKVQCVNDISAAIQNTPLAVT